jgi:hypothetical protein
MQKEMDVEMLRHLQRAAAAAADQTIIITSHGRIGSDLDALNNTSWIATA